MHAAAAAERGPAEVARFEVLREPVRLPDGSILALGIRLHNGIQEVDARVSRDEGTSWSVPLPLFRLPREEGGFGFYETFVDRRGEIHLFLLCDGKTGLALPLKDKPATQVLDIWQVRSTASATAWESPRRIWTGRAGDLLSAVQLPGGRIILPISFQTDRSWSHRDPGFPAFTHMGQFSTSALYSDDDGTELTNGGPAGETACPTWIYTLLLSQEGESRARRAGRREVLLANSHLDRSA